MPLTFVLSRLRRAPSVSPLRRALFGGTQQQLCVRCVVSLIEHRHDGNCAARVVRTRLAESGRRSRRCGRGRCGLAGLSGLAYTPRGSVSRKRLVGIKKALHACHSAIMDGEDICNRGVLMGSVEHFSLDVVANRNRVTDSARGGR